MRAKKGTKSDTNKVVYIYGVRDTAINQIIYVGSTIWPIEARWRTHLREIRCKKHTNTKSQDHVLNIGVSAIKIELLG